MSPYDKLYKKIEAVCLTEGRLPTQDELALLTKTRAKEHGQTGAKKLKERYGNDAHSVIGKLGAQKRWAAYRKRQKVDKSPQS